MSIELFRDDSYLKACTTHVVEHVEGGFVTQETVFYPAGGGQPGDQGICGALKIVDTIKGEGGRIIHRIADDQESPAIDAEVTLELDWQRRYRLMRMHTALHLLCSLVDAPVTGGSIGEAKSRLDFDLEQAPDKMALTEQLLALIEQDHPIEVSRISDEELDSNPELVRTMSVKPPRGSGFVRMVGIGTDENRVDYQPCGGTHVHSTSEIGPVRVSKIEKKGKQNRRVSIQFAEG